MADEPVGPHFRRGGAQPWFHEWWCCVTQKQELRRVTAGMSAFVTLWFPVPLEFL